jgi:hypothetical protein
MSGYEQIPRLLVPAEHAPGAGTTAFEESPRRPLRLLVDNTEIPKGSDLAASALLDVHDQSDIVLFCTEPVKGHGSIKFEGSQIAFIGPDGGSKLTVGSMSSTLLAGLPEHLAETTGLPERGLEKLVGLLFALRDGGFDGLVAETVTLAAIEGSDAAALLDSYVTLSFADAIALVGLLLRTREEAVFHLDPGFSLQMETQEAREIIALDLLGPWWRWSAATADDQEQQALFLSIVRRVQFALRVRDELASRRQRKPLASVDSDSSFLFEAGLLFLTAAFDALARLVNMAYDLDVDSRQVGWRRRYWLKELGKVDSGVANSMKTGTHDRAVLEAVAIPRNLIHGAGLEGKLSVPASTRNSAPKLIGDNIQIATDPRSVMTTLPLPKVEAKELREAMKYLDPSESWDLGITFAGNDYGLAIEPMDYFESALLASTATLTRLMALVGPERLASSEALPLPNERPAGNDVDPFSTGVIELLRLHFALEPLRSSDSGGQSSSNNRA